MNNKELIDRKCCIIFDLDGTLIDSAEAIISALESTLLKFQINPIKAIDRSLIGPPLDKILLELLPKESEYLLPEISSYFRVLYDDFFCVQCALYPSVIEVLENLVVSKRLFVVTNKREIPTKRILAHCNLDRFFEHIYGIDTTGKQDVTKKDVIGYLLSNNNLKPKDCLYIGDTVHDMESCLAVAVDFIFAEWGYGDCPSHQINRSEFIADLISLVEK
ncbi:MAG: phosphoglycolate phosphatase [Patiriisocius sp.]